MASLSPLSAEIVFTQGEVVGTAGQALAGVEGVSVTFANYNDSRVVSWLWTMVSVPINSSVNVGTLTTSASGSFTPDCTGGCWLIQLVVTDAVGNQASAQSVFGVRDPNIGWMVPALSGDSTAHNFSGQTRGWAGTNSIKMLDKMLYSLMGAFSGPSGPSVNNVIKYNGSNWIPGNIPAYHAVKYNGSLVASGDSTLNFVGATVTSSAGVTTVTIASSSTTSLETGYDISMNPGPIVRAIGGVPIAQIQGTVGGVPRSSVNSVLTSVSSGNLTAVAADSNLLSADVWVAATGGFICFPFSGSNSNAENQAIGNSYMLSVNGTFETYPFTYSTDISSLAALSMVVSGSYLYAFYAQQGDSSTSLIIKLNILTGKIEEYMVLPYMEWGASSKRALAFDRINNQLWVGGVYGGTATIKLLNAANFAVVNTWTLNDRTINSIADIIMEPYAGVPYGVYHVVVTCDDGYLYRLANTSPYTKTSLNMGGTVDALVYYSNSPNPKIFGIQASTHKFIRYDITTGTIDYTSSVVSYLQSNAYSVVSNVVATDNLYYVPAVGSHYVITNPCVTEPTIDLVGALFNDLNDYYSFGNLAVLVSPNSQDSEDKNLYPRIYSVNNELDAYGIAHSALNYSVLFFTDGNIDIIGVKHYDVLDSVTFKPITVPYLSTISNPGVNGQFQCYGTNLYFTIASTLYTVGLTPYAT